MKRTPGRESHADYLSRVCSSLPPSGSAKTAVDPTVSDHQIRRRTNLRTRRPGLYPTTAPLTPPESKEPAFPATPRSNPKHPYRRVPRCGAVDVGDAPRARPNCEECCNERLPADRRTVADMGGQRLAVTAECLGSL